ncbi:cell division protein FtsA [Dysgonomonas sp. 520]|uniref:cell division protein FtsA n=1 Tax=Dysgonomonas sp. 520 TaxID=2302931 RepID=UPI0013D738B9|nr:cell division protein FtsA [Dysgonomonas sp. 520]NDW10866.1 cell division protein FtsA [Dysgonomonas sp. 520]
MEQSGFIVAVDFGSSKIVGLLGRKNEQGVISVLASESIASDSCIKQGIVYNIEEAAGKLKRIINLLENKTGKKIGKIYVSIAGRSLRAVEYMQTRALDSGSEVTFQDIDQMTQQARMNKPEFFANYSVVAPEIFLDGIRVNSEEEAIGKTASLIEGRYRLIVGRPDIKANLIKCVVDKNQLEIAGYIVGPVATAAILLDDEDKKAGCALIDFGAGVTTVSIYKDGLLRYMTVVPFGGRTVTRDVQSLGFVDTAAESYKMKYGRIGKDKSKPLGQSTSEVDVKELNKVIQLREDEIIANVQNQLRESGYMDQLEAGIIITGGASQMNGLLEYLEDKFKMPVKRATVKRLFINNAADLVQNPIYTQCLGLLLFGNENCEKVEVINSRERPYDAGYQQQPQPAQPAQPTQPQPENKPEPAPQAEKVQPKPEPESEKPAKKKKKSDFWGKLQGFAGTMFKDEDFRDDDEDEEEK